MTKMAKRTVRERQEQTARDQDMVFTHVFRDDNGDLFEAVASTEKDALRVLRAERPSASRFPRYCGVKE